MYLKELQTHLLHDFDARSELRKAFKKLHESVSKRMPRVLGRTVCRLAARRLLNKALQVRKEQVGSLHKSIRSIKLPKGRTLVKAVTICPQSHISMTPLTSLYRGTLPYLSMRLASV